MRTKIFSVTKKDCVWKMTKGSGAGGQHRNKKSTAVYCSHPPSGAQGYSCDTRQQGKNKKIAFRRMAETKKFQDWIKFQSAKKMGLIQKVEEKVYKQLKNIKVEVKEDGRWVEDNNNKEKAL